MTGEQRDLIARPTEAVAAPPVDALNPLALIQQALASGVDVASLEKLQAMAERHEERAARKAFFAALASFQAAVSVISKNRDGHEGRYRFADFAQVVDTIREPLAHYGLSYSFDQVVDGGNLVTTCYLRHRDGHGESSTFACPVESRAGMSAQQKMGSASSYGKRYSLLGVTGLATGEVDNDGAGDPADVLPITDEQLGELTDRLNACGADLGRFKAYMGVSDLGDISRGAWGQALKAVEAKERAAGEAS